MVVERGHEVVVINVVGDEFCSFLGEHAVEEKFTKIKRGGFSTGVAVVYAKFTRDGDACSVQVFLGGAELSHHFCDGDVYAAIGWDVVKEDGAEGVSVFDARAGAG